MRKGMSDIKELLKSINPRKVEGEYVFCTVSDEAQLNLNPLMIFKEKESTTLILRKEEADNSRLKYNYVFGIITLDAHSDLNAIGLLAAITNKLVEKGISLNAVSAYYHDHLFVPIDKVNKAIKALRELK